MWKEKRSFVLVSGGVSATGEVLYVGIVGDIGNINMKHCHNVQHQCPTSPQCQTLMSHPSTMSNIDVRQSTMCDVDVGDQTLISGFQNPLNRRRRPQVDHLQTTSLLWSLQLCSSLFQPAHLTSRWETCQSPLPRVQWHLGQLHGFLSDNLCVHHAETQLHLHHGSYSGWTFGLLKFHVKKPSPGLWNILTCTLLQMVIFFVQT